MCVLCAVCCVGHDNQKSCALLRMLLRLRHVYMVYENTITSYQTAPHRHYDRVPHILLWLLLVRCTALTLRRWSRLAKRREWGCNTETFMKKKDRSNKNGPSGSLHESTSTYSSAHSILIGCSAGTSDRKSFVLQHQTRINTKITRRKTDHYYSLLLLLLLPYFTAQLTGVM